MVQNRQPASYHPNTVHSCSRHGSVATRLTTERPASIVPIPKTFTILAVHS